ANDSDADDIAQETFLAAWTQAKSFRGQGSVRSWLFSIAWRKAKGSQRQWFRSARRDTAYHESLLRDEVGGPKFALRPATPTSAHGSAAGSTCGGHVVPRGWANPRRDI